MPKRNRRSRPRPPQRERRNLTSESMFLATCATCGKRSYKSKQEAKRGAARVHPGAQLRFYQCGEYWHMTSVDADVMTEIRDQREDAS